ncbi:MAG: trehalose-phosphatase, partial [Propionibacteriales bacterium]|nr:trehalose-phosphatase [Propionibacteriales bacterium]
MVMTSSLSDAGIEAMRAVMREPGRTLLATDFDGVLSPIVDDPTQAVALPAAVRALGRAGQCLGQVAVITGRPARKAVELGGFTTTPGLEELIVL